MTSRIWLAGMAAVLVMQSVWAGQNCPMRPLDPMLQGGGGGRTYESASARNPEALLRNAFMDVEVRDSLVYCLQGLLCGDSCASLMILNIKDPTAPTFISRLRFHGGAESGFQIRLTDRLAYLTITAPGGSSRLHAVDVSDPTQPTVIGSYPFSGYARGLDVVDNLVFIVSGSDIPGDSINGVYVLNAANVAAIRAVDTVPTEYGLDYIRICGDHAYATGVDDLYVVDVSMADSLFSVARLPTAFYTYAVDIESGDSLLYLANGDVIWPAVWSALSIVNVARPEAPSVLSDYILPGLVYDVIVRESWAFLSHGSCGLEVFDVTDPVAPVRGAPYEVPGFAGRIAIQDSILLLPDIGPFAVNEEYYFCDPPALGPNDPQEGDLLILSIADPTNPTLLGFYTPTAQDPTGVDDDIPAEQLPSTFTLYQNYPNPFNPGTMIEFDLPVRSEVQLTVYNLLGQEVTRLVQSRSAGHHTIQLNMRDQASGVYFYELRTGDYSGSGKMLLLK